MADVTHDDAARQGRGTVAAIACSNAVLTAS